MRPRWRSGERDDVSVVGAVIAVGFREAEDSAHDLKEAVRHSGHTAQVSPGADVRNSVPGADAAWWVAYETPVSSTSYLPRTDDLHIMLLLRAGPRA
jgi:hypothetical protein